MLLQDSLGLGQIPLATGWWTHHQYIGLHTKTAKEQSRTNEEEPLFLEVGECESDVWSRPLSLCRHLAVFQLGCVAKRVSIARRFCFFNLYISISIGVGFFFYRCWFLFFLSVLVGAAMLWHSNSRRLPKQSLNCHWRLL